MRRLEQAGVISRLEANSAYDDLLSLKIKLFPIAPLAERVWVLCGNLTIYNALHAALAQALDCALATLDSKLSRAQGPACEVITPPDW